MPAVSTLNMTDEDVIRSFPRCQKQGVSGFVTDFLGTKTRTSYIITLPEKDGMVEDYPIPMNFHATSTEWAGVLRAVLSAKDELVAVELGAGWAPWLVSVAHAAKIRGINKCRLVGVEGSKQHCDYMFSHFADNGIDPEVHTLLHGIVGTSDGMAEFPILANPAGDWGTQAVKGSQTGGIGRRALRAVGAVVRALLKGSAANRFPTEKVKCYGLPTLLRDFQCVDVVHVDIQGDEYDVVHSARRVLKQKVKRLVIGTHGRTIEQQIMQELAAQSWVLESDESCKYEQRGLEMILWRDGCQVWRNTAFDKCC